MTRQHSKPPITILHAYSKNVEGIINASFYLETSFSQRSRTDSSHSSSAFSSGPPIEQYDYPSSVDNFEDEDDYTSSRSYGRSGSKSHGNRSNLSIYSSSTESDYIFGSENFGTFPNAHNGAPRISPAVVSWTNSDATDKYRDCSRNMGNLPTLQKSAMTAYLASPTKRRWMDLVRTLRVEHRIASIGFTSLYDSEGSGVDDDDDDSANSDMERINDNECVEQREELVDDWSNARTSRTFEGANDEHRTVAECLVKFPTEHDFVRSNNRFMTSLEQFVNDASQKAQGVDDGGNLDTFPHSNTRRGCPVIDTNTSGGKIEQQQNNLSFRVKTSIQSFMEQPTQSRWLELVRSLREDRTRDDHIINNHWDLDWKEPEVEEDIYKSWSSKIYQSSNNNEICEADWDVSRLPTFNNDVAINASPKPKSLGNLGINQKSAMEAFMQQPSKDRWDALVQSMRREKPKPIKVANALGSMISDVKIVTANDVPTNDPERKGMRRPCNETEDEQNCNKHAKVTLQQVPQTKVVSAPKKKRGVDESVKIWEEWIQRRAGNST
ncbi:hypothetical protein ACHAXS_003917 [Conticribra weissflogii]